MATVSFMLGGLAFEYDEEKNLKNIRKHGIDFHTAARVFFDYDRIEKIDEGHSEEERYDTIGNASSGFFFNCTAIGTPCIINGSDDILFVVYTDRIRTTINGSKTDVTRIISARLATEFERGVYYGKY